MALVTGQTWEAEVPHEPGEKFTFKKLSWLEWKKALEAQQNRELDKVARMGTDVIAALENVERPESDRDVQKYDQGIVLRSSIVSWTYADKCNAENIDALDEATAAWAYQQVIATLIPRTKTEQKNG